MRTIGSGEERAAYLDQLAARRRRAGLRCENDVWRTAVTQRIRRVFAIQREMMLIESRARRRSPSQVIAGLEDWERDSPFPAHIRSFGHRVGTPRYPLKSHENCLGCEPVVLTDDAGAVWAVAPIEFRLGGVCLAVPHGVASMHITARMVTEVGSMLPRSALAGNSSAGGSRFTVELIDAMDDIFLGVTVLDSVDDVLELLRPEHYFEFEGRYLGARALASA